MPARASSWECLFQGRGMQPSCTSIVWRLCRSVSGWNVEGDGDAEIGGGFGEGLFDGGAMPLLEGECGWKREGEGVALGGNFGSGEERGGDEGGVGGGT